MSDEAGNKRALLASPTYCFGSLLLPEDQAGEWVLAFDYCLPADFWELPEENQLDRFKGFFSWLVLKQDLKTSVNTPRIISPSYWLQSQKKLSSELKQEGLPEGQADKVEAVTAFLGETAE